MMNFELNMPFGPLSGSSSGVSTSGAPGAGTYPRRIRKKTKNDSASDVPEATASTFPLLTQGPILQISDVPFDPGT